MLAHQTTQKLNALLLGGMAEALEMQRANPSSSSLPFEDRLAILVDAEMQFRENKRRQRILKKAKLKYPSASPEDINYIKDRGIDKAYLAGLMSCDWIERGQHVIFTGPTGLGKSWIACALATQAARKNYSVGSYRFTRLLEDLETARAIGTLPKFRTQLARFDLLIIDDWGMAELTAQGRQDLMEVIDDRVPAGALLITSQYPVDTWHARLGDPTIADSILDRVMEGAHQFVLRGESMRRHRRPSVEASDVI